jgi:hypothetical protein
MIQTVNSSSFVDAFRSYDRQDNFCYNALHALFDWYEELDPNWELDVIAICCEWAEYTDAKSILREYPNYCEGLDVDSPLSDFANALQYYTTVLEFDGGILVAEF